jgi:hypothetical protein
VIWCTITSLHFTVHSASLVGGQLDGWQIQLSHGNRGDMNLLLASQSLVSLSELVVWVKSRVHKSRGGAREAIAAWLTRFAICFFFCFNAARDLFQSKRKRVFSHLNSA